MRLRTYLHGYRLAAGLSVRAVAAQTGLAIGTISELERGYAVPTDKQAAAMVVVYGDPAGWYPATVLAALQPDRICPGCDEPLEPDALRTRVYHGEECRRRYRHRLATERKEA